MSGFQVFALIVIGFSGGLVSGIYFAVGSSQFQERLTRIQANKAALKAAQDAVASLKQAIVRDSQ